MSDAGPSAGAKIDAVVLAGGEGTRLKPFTDLIPKPLVTIGGIPVMEFVLRQLERFGFHRIAIALGHKADQIKAKFGSGRLLDVHLSYIKEDSPLGTAGPLATVEGLNENFLVLNGDLLTTLNYQKLFEAHARSDGILTIAAHERFVPVDFGVIKGRKEVVRNYVEKPTLQYRVSMGVYVFNRRVIEYLPEGKRLDFPDLVQTLLGAGETVRYFPFEGYWLDIGSKVDYEQAQEDYPSMKAALLGEVDPSEN